MAELTLETFGRYTDKKDAEFAYWFYSHWYHREFARSE